MPPVKLSLLLTVLHILTGLSFAAAAGPAQQVAWDNDTYDVARVRPRLADRFYLESVLLELFGPDAASAVFENVIKPDSVMGGPCDVYEQQRTGETPDAFTDQRLRCFSGKMAMTLPMVPKANLVREGYITKVCGRLSADPKTLKYFTRKTLGARYAATALEDSDYTALFQAFHPEVTPPPRVLGALKKVGESAASGASPLQRITQTLCLDTSWQVL